MPTISSQGWGLGVGALLGWFAHREGFLSGKFGELEAVGIGAAVGYLVGPSLIAMIPTGTASPATTTVTTTTPQSA